MGKNRGVDIAERERRDTKHAPFADEQRLLVLASERTEHRIVCTFGPAPSLLVVTWNRGAGRQLGYEAEEVRDSSINRILPEDRTARELFYASLEDARALGCVERDVLARRKDGVEIWLAADLTYLPSDVVLGGAYCLVAKDVTEDRRRLRRLKHDALHDPLTGLANRRLLMDRMGQALSRAQRRSEHVATFVVDVDGFKKINDREGHESGDEVLKLVADILRSAVRPEDTVARLGGDEFVLVCEGLTDVSEVQSIGGRVSRMLAAASTPEGRALSLSTGVVFSKATGWTSGGSLLRLADVAMYRAKRLGGGTMEILQNG